MRFFQYILLSVFFLYMGFAQSIAQNKPIMPGSGSGPRIYLSMGIVSDKVKSFQNKNSIGTVELINGSYISANNNVLSVNEKTLKAAIRTAFPDSLMQGIGALDWEGEEIQILRKGDAGDPRFIKAMNDMMLALDIAQKTRPNVLWGYYGFPFREFWKRDADWEMSNNRIAALLKKQDVLLPSVYLFYDDKTVRASNNSNEGYILDNIEQSLSFGTKFAKPVLPFIYHRYQNFTLMPVNVFANQVQLIMSGNVKGKHVDGVVWWGADKYYYRVKNNTLVKEVGPGEDYQQHYDSLILEYCRKIVKNFR